MTDRPDEMEQVQAAREFLDAHHPHDTKRREQVELDAFMAIFHPDHDRIVLEEAEDDPSTG